MKKLIVSLVIVLLCAMQSQAIAVSKIYGANVNGPAPVVPFNTVVLCQAPEFCTRTMAPDWSNENIFYGYNGTNCGKSVDGGDTWQNCPANPSATIYPYYAVTRNGTVLAAGNDAGGTVLRIRRSTDGAVSWATVYDALPVDTLYITVTNGRFRCAQTADLCAYYGRDSAVQMFSLISTDDGLTWTLTSGIGQNSFSYINTAWSNDGSIGIGAVSAGDGVSTIRTMEWNGVAYLRNATNFPTTVGGLCNFPFILNGARRVICHETGSGTTYTMRSEDGTVISTFNLSGVPSDSGGNQVGQSTSTAGAIYLLRSTTIGQTGLWVSVDNAASFVQIFTTDPAGIGIGMQGSAFVGVNGCVYFSYLTSASTSTVLRVCL